jgi:hypothetical protein
LPETVEELLTRRERVKAERKPAKPKRKRNPNPILQRITQSPAQLWRVMQYHHPDKNNPGADVNLFHRAKNMLKSTRNWEKKARATA